MANAGIRSPLFLLGISAAPSTAQGGVVSMLAPWIGGANAPATTRAGYRGLLGLWIGGACAPVVVPPVPPPAGGGGGGWLGMRPPGRRSIKIAPDFQTEDGELMEILAIIFPNIL